MMHPEPIIPMAALDDEALAFAAHLVSTKGATKGRIKTTRPADDELYYVWRMVRFYVSPDPRASCMPMGAIYALPRTNHEHANTCGRSTAFYGSIEAAYADRSGAGMFNEDGNYRTACNCGADERTAQSRAAEKANQDRLDAIVARIVATIPPKSQYGMRRWTKAFTGSDPLGNGDILDPTNHHVLDPMDELDGVLM